MSDTTRPQRGAHADPSSSSSSSSSSPSSPSDEEQVATTSGAPKADVVGAVGGRAIPGPLRIVKLAKRGVEVMLPGNATFREWAQALQRANVFPDQAAAMSALVTAQTIEVASDGRDAADKRPIVGVVISEAKMLAGAHKNTDTIVELVERMGCRPVLVPPCADLVVTGGPEARQRAIAALASSLDGLVGPGGADVDPSIYGEQNTDALHTNVVRDRFEADFTRTALDGDLFGFGICRSHQLWNAAAGGSLVQDVQHEGVVSISHKRGEHGFTLERRSMIFEAVRQEYFRVNSFHHQAVDFAGWGFRVVGTVRDPVSGKDMIEATERWNAVTVQFHPEVLQESAPHRAMMSMLGRRAHLFQLVKQLRREGRASLNVLVDEMKKAKQFDASDVAWAKRELARRLRT